MPLLDIATSLPFSRNHFGTLRFQSLLHGTTTTSVELTFGMEKSLSSSWEVFIQIPRKVNFDMGNRRGALMIKAVATLEPKCLVQSGGQTKVSLGSDSDPQLSMYPSEDSSEVDERERLRRLRISKANKGNVPWNKGRKHSEETLRRIRERTKLAMQDPKVKMKLVNLGHAQSEETRTKIGAGVRIGWQRRRQKLMVQETCCFEWQNLIAEASRKGYAGEELQWNSYEELDEQLKQEWLDSIEKRKLMPRPKGSQRAPKSLEQRRKISEAISAKWADPNYRERVCYALAKYHGTPEGAERKPRRRPSGDGTRNPLRKKANEAYNDLGSESKSQASSRVKKSRAAPYKDPLADSKLEMIRNIRSQRAAMETKKIEAIERAKLLIAEAEKAAKALEVAATKSPLALASLIETRKLIAEATRSIQAAESGQIASLRNKNGSYSSFKLNGEENNFEDETGEGNESLSSADKKEVNGTHILSSSSDRMISDFEFGNYDLENVLDDEEPIEMSSSKDHSSNQLELNGLSHQLDQQYEQTDPVEPDEAMKYQTTAQEKRGEKEDMGSNKTTVKRKWIRGRLIEVVEGE